MSSKSAQGRATSTSRNHRRRAAPIKSVGAVNVLAPGGTSRYFRLTWTDPVTGKVGGTTAGTNLTVALDRAATKNRQLGALRAGVSRTQTVGDLVAAFVADPRGRGHMGSDMSASRMADVTRLLRRASVGHLDVPLLVLDRARVDAMRAQGGTAATVRENTTALRLLLRWGHRKGLLDAAVGDLLAASAAAVEPAGPVRAASCAPRRRRSARKAGSSPLFVEDAPSLPGVRALREQVELLQTRWGALAVELAGGCGTRWGEQFQLTAHDVLVSGQGVEIQVLWQIDAKAKADAPSRRKRPKGEKTRLTSVPARSQTGYPLAQELVARRDAALAEQAAGTNPEALLFPTKTGKLYIHTAFSADVFKPAALAAGWPYQEWQAEETVTGKDGSVERVVRHRIQFDLTWHSLRHRYARFAIDVLHLEEGELTVQGGWEDVEIVRKRYYKSGDEHRESARRKIHGEGAHPSPGPDAAVPAPAQTSLEALRLDLMRDVRAGNVTLEVYGRLMDDLDRLEQRRRGS